MLSEDVKLQTGRLWMLPELWKLSGSDWGLGRIRVILVKIYPSLTFRTAFGANMTRGCSSSGLEFGIHCTPSFMVQLWFSVSRAPEIKLQIKILSKRKTFTEQMC